MLVRAKTASDVSLGENIVLGGLVLQIVIFCVFVAVAGVFNSRMRKRPTPGSSQFQWQRLLAGLYIVSALITLRNVIRCIEYGMGSDGYFLQHEWTTYVFDAAAMALVLLFCLQWYFSGIGSRPKMENIEIALEQRNQPKY